ncbi:hypothetical protein BJ878DRAFT_458667 [Calycina marina]|uniref:Uncharacterized protein n=1 Tax=Calycina marina TaxID=1763456 RepID=A0A9P7Z4M1_9HELO|nr:hypothetical protein BJ878DRAFT_458667 [Calycina marina]
MDSVTISSEIPTFTFPSEISTILSTSVTDILPIPTLSDIPQTSSDIIVPTSVVPTDTPLPTDTAIPTETVVPTDTSLPNLTIPLSIPLTTDIPSLKTPITIVSPTVSPTASPTILIPVPTDTPSLTVPITIVSPTVSPTISIPFTTDTSIPTDTSVTRTSWLPESLIFASSISLASGATQSAEPSNFPAIIPNPTGVITTIPEGLSLVQIGFKFSLNWQFVASHSVSASQIMDLLPQGLMYGLDLQSSQVEVDSLVPLDTTEQLGFTTTVAHVYLSDNMTDTLRLDLLIPASKLYSNPNANVNQLMSYISVAIPISVDSTFTDTTSSATGNAASPTTNSNSGVFDTQPQDTSSSVTKNAVGVSFAVAGAAAAYGAAMFFIARRYKKRRQNHRRSSSVMSHSEMRQSGSPALVGGANTYMAGGRGSPNDRDSRGSGSTGQSGRTQQISGPMMAENSLGWN